MNKITILKILEYTWLVVGIVCLAMVAYSLNQKDTGQSILFLVFSVVSGFLFRLRRQQRKWAEKN